jgi:hypothetical protein
MLVRGARNRQLVLGTDFGEGKGQFYNCSITVRVENLLKMQKERTESMR